MKPANFMYINITSYSKALKSTEPKKELSALWFLKLATAPFKALLSLNFFQRSKPLFSKLNILNKAPFGAVVVFWLVVLTLVILIANKLRYDFFVDLITKNFPEAVTVPTDSTGQPLYMSQLDRMFAEFNAIVNVGFFIFFAIKLREFLQMVWYTYNPRKQQIMGRV